MDTKVICWWRRAGFQSLVFAVLFLAHGPVFAAQNVTLTWSPSPDTNVVGYNVYYGSASRSYTNKLNAGSSTNLVIGGLKEGVTYYFAATAYNILAIESDYSAEVSYLVPVTVPGSNKPPTLNAIASVVVNQGAPQQVVSLSGISSGTNSEVQVLAITAASSNPGLIPNPSVSYTSPNSTGSLAFTPVANVSGSATITVTVNDGGAGGITIRTFTVTVNAANPGNAAPTLDMLNP
ncbi:MAG: fibronectin type III domain-containing protein, partial [Akkermansiaceae bacterium]|nr:fibronectin type III domain-containing protein [Verrucomicrobiales bacterium]